MFNCILAYYWTPKGTPLWKHHLPQLLIGTIFVALTIFLGLVEARDLIPMFCVLLTLQIVLGYLALKRFGNKNPRSKD